MEIFLILLYIILFSLLIYKVRFFNIPGISRKVLIAVFILKIAFTTFYGVLHYEYYTFGDTFDYFHDGNVIFATLKENPSDYFRFTFGPNGGQLPPRYQPLIDEMEGFWENTGSYTVVRVNAIMRWFSFGYYNIHAIFFAFISLIGLVAIYKVFNAQYPDKKKLFAIVIFLIPSVLFYGSGLHKEGLSIFSLGILLYNFYFWTHNQKRWFNFVVFAGAAVLLFIIKEFYIATLLPCLVAYYWIIKQPKYAFLKFFLVILIYWVTLFNLHHIFPAFNLSVLIADKQSEFLDLKGKSDLPMENLKPEPSEIMATVPEAIVNTLIRPYPNEIENVYQLFYFIEVMIIVLLILLAIIFFHRKSLKYAPLAYLAFFFSLSTFIIVGLIVPNLGAISRYKSPALIFLACFLVVIMRPWKKDIFNLT